MKETFWQSIEINVVRRSTTLHAVEEIRKLMYIIKKKKKKVIIINKTQALEEGIMVMEQKELLSTELWCEFSVLKGVVVVSRNNQMLCITS